MLIKSADDKTAAIEELERLLDEAPRATKASILKELRNLRAGIKGERESAYELDFYISKNNNFALIHDLRLDIDGRVAQIDHLFINRLLEVFVIETKHFSQGLSINERGEFMAWYNGSAVGIASPLSQNDRHIEVLKDAFKNIALPKRLGFTLNPTMKSIVMISKNAKISRPADEKFDSSNVLKADQFSGWYDKTAAQGTAILAKVVSGETIIDIANKLASMHTPIEFNYREKFGLGATSGPAQTAAPAERDTQGGRYTCAACECTLPYAVAKFCWNQKAKFHGKAYCRECQTNGATSLILTAAPSPAAPIAPAQASLFPPSPPQSPMATPTPPEPATADPANKYSCAGCPTKVPYTVAKFCWNMKGKFGGKVYCRECQPKVTQGGVPASPTAPAGAAPTIGAGQPPAPAESSSMVPHAAAPPPVLPHPTVTPSPSYVVTIGATNIGSAQPPKARPATPPADPANKYACSGCPAKVPYAVAKFCWNQKAKFGGRVFCRDCQKAH